MQVEKPAAAINVKRELEDGWFQHVEMPLPARAHDSVGHQQAALCHADGHQEGQDQGSAARVTAAEPARQAARRRRRSSAIYLPQKQKADADLSTATPKEAAAQAGREAEVRGAGHMSVLVVLEQRGGRLEPHDVGDAGRRPAARAQARTQPTVGVIGRANGALCRRSSPVKKLRQSASRSSTRCWSTTPPDGYTLALEQLIAKLSPGLRRLSRTPTRSATSRPSSRRASTGC